MKWQVNGIENQGTKNDVVEIEYKLYIQLRQAMLVWLQRE